MLNDSSRYIYNENHFIKCLLIDIINNIICQGNNDFITFISFIPFIPYDSCFNYFEKIFLFVIFFLK